MMSDTPQPPKRRRRWFRFSLRTLLVVVTIFCVVLAYWVYRANRQKAVVEWVEENGGEVYYDFQYDEKDVYIEDAKPPGPEWVQSFLGNDYLATVVEVELKDIELKDVARLVELEHLKALYLYNTQVSDLTPLVQMKNLAELYLHNTQVSELKSLAELKSLKHLNLKNTSVSDLTPLAGLTNLYGLNLINTQVSDLTPLAGMTSLEVLSLDYTPVSDLTPLMQLASLGYLSLNNTNVTQEQIDELQNALPNCEIYWSPRAKAIEGN